MMLGMGIGTDLRVQTPVTAASVTSRIPNQEGSHSFLDDREVAAGWESVSECEDDMTGNSRGTQSMKQSTESFNKASDGVT
jgi:hypothetical protein